MRVAGRPNLTPLALACPKPALIFSRNLAFELLDSIERVENHFAGHLGSVDAPGWNDQGNFVRDKVPKHPHELIKTAAKPIRAEGQHDLRFTSRMSVSKWVTT